jgi:DnaK suppressor protein
MAAKSAVVGAAIVPPDYHPTEKEKYMNPVMLEYFRQKLLRQKNDLLKESSETLSTMQTEGGMQEPDIADRATAETDLGVELRTRDRYRKLLSKIDSALRRIEDGSYGFCEETGEPIGVARLEARPVATLSIEAQERHERVEKTQRDDV